MARLTPFLLLVVLAGVSAVGCGGSDPAPQKVVTCTGTGALQCGAHGVCDASGGAAVCTCQTAYAGTTCDTCSDGFQDADGDGTCRATCATAALSCTHGTCSDASGVAACVCETGFTGPACDVCAAGLQDRDGDGHCAPACEAATCGGHGTCDDGSGSASCSCTEGYAGPSCDLCAEGFQDHDADGVCASSCGAASCSGHGTCEDTSGVAVCACDSSHQGPTCDACLAGFQDNDHDGTCRADCSDFPACTGANQTCSDANGTATCVCTAGFSDVGTGCTWAGSLQDPGFDGTPEGVWTPTNGASLLPAQSEALFDFDSICTELGTVSQTFSLPDPPPAAPLALSLLARYTCDAAPCLGNEVFEELAVDLGGKRVFVGGIQKGFSEHRVCLGEAAFGGGGETNLTLTPGQRSNCWLDSSLSVELDHADLVSDAACPPLGSLLNGDFSGGEAGWTFDAHDSSSPSGASAGVVSSGPLDGSAAARLQLTHLCSEAQASTLVSVPLAAGSRLHFDAQVDAGQTVLLSLDGKALGSLTGTGSPQSQSICLPAGLEGTVHALTFASPNLTGSCTAPVAFTLFLDNVSVAQDASCASMTGIQDPGFESDPGAAFQSWSLNEAASLSAGAAHTGTQGLSFLGLADNSYAEARTAITVPRAAGSDGPALRFWLKSSAVALDVELRGWLSHPVAETGGGWSPVLVCLPPERSGASEDLSFSVFISSGANQGAAVDDLELTTSPSCPAK